MSIKACLSFCIWSVTSCSINQSDNKNNVSKSCLVQNSKKNKKKSHKKSIKTDGLVIDTEVPLDNVHRGLIGEFGMV